jgi:RNA polymerase sigma-70 factor (ECF subfamily)
MTTATVEEAYVRYGSAVYKFLLRRTGSHHDAEELTQQVFADVASAVSRGDAPRSMRGWLYAVAERRLIDELRSRKRAAEVAAALAPERDHAVDTTPAGLAEAVRRLPLLERRIVVLRVVEGRTYRDIARELGCTEGACKMRLSRALQRLRDDSSLAT